MVVLTRGPKDDTQKIKLSRPNTITGACHGSNWPEIVGGLAYSHHSKLAFGPAVTRMIHKSLDRLSGSPSLFIDRYL